MALFCRSCLGRKSPLSDLDLDIVGPFSPAGLPSAFHPTGGRDQSGICRPAGWSRHESQGRAVRPQPLSCIARLIHLIPASARPPRRAIELDPDYALAPAYVALALMMEHDYDQALDSIKERARTAFSASSSKAVCGAPAT